MVEGEKFKLRNLVSRTSSLLCSAANSVGTSRAFAAFEAVQIHFPRKNTHVFISVGLRLKKKKANKY